MVTETSSNFQRFLDAHDDWAIRIEMRPGESAYAYDAEKLLALLTARDRGEFSVILRTSNATEQGRATISKLITGKLKEEQATRACIGIAQFYNENALK